MTVPPRPIPDQVRTGSRLRNDEENRPDRTALFKLYRGSGGGTSNRDQFIAIGIAKISEI